MNPEYYHFLDTLAERKFSGEVTLYFRDGSIESHIISERFSKSEIKALVKANKKAKIIIPRKQK